MIVKKCEVVKVEAIVRGYITGSAWSEYKKSQTVHSIPMPAGLVESQKLPKPIFTPSTKADQGEHDENIHPDKGACRLEYGGCPMTLTLQPDSQGHLWS